MKDQRYYKDKALADSLKPQLRSALALLADTPESAIIDAPTQADMQRNTDFFICTKALDPFGLESENVRVMCRVRRHGYLSRHKQFTFRLRYNRDGDTEFSKTLRGYGRYMLCAWASPDGTALVRAKLLDLSVFRVQYATRSKDVGRRCTNPGPHDSAFMLFTTDEFTDALVVKDLVLNDGKQLPLWAA